MENDLDSATVGNSFSLEEEVEHLRFKLKTYEKLEHKLVSMYPEISSAPFLTSWDKKSYPPEYVHVCPAFGCNDLYVYKLERVLLQEGS